MSDYLNRKNSLRKGGRICCAVVMCLQKYFGIIVWEEILYVHFLSVAI